MLALLGFVLIFGLSLRVVNLRKSIFSRTLQQWVIDSAGLFVQGWLVPLAKIYGLYVVFDLTLGGLKSSIEISPWWAFCLSFVLVDYLYYWNHRLLHTPRFWPLHKIHHSTEHLDLLSSARNTLVTPLFIVYLWVHSFMAFILKDSTYYVLGATLTAILDLWRHSPGLEWRFLSRVFLKKIWITPSLHGWHHSVYGMQKNFGANFSLWDRLHGTWGEPIAHKIKYGWADPTPLWRQLFYPWPRKVGDK
jgi:sterol desaturase/sphingolipid hydroxylase (fatty acid hydroxylase superfamily)